MEPGNRNREMSSPTMNGSEYREECFLSSGQKGRSLDLREIGRQAGREEEGRRKAEGIPARCLLQRCFLMSAEHASPQAGVRHNPPPNHSQTPTPEGQVRQVRQEAGVR